MADEQNQDQVAPTVSAVQSGDLTKGIQIPRPSDHMTSDGGMAGRHAKHATDGLAAALERIDDLVDSLEQLTIQNARLIERVEDIDRRLKNLEAKNG
jgi:hypothetical protein